MKLKNFLVVQDSDHVFHVWALQDYERYIRGCVKVGAGSAFKIVTHFNGQEDLLNDVSQLSGNGREEERIKEEVEGFMRFCNLMATFRETWPRYLQSLCTEPSTDNQGKIENV